MDDRMLHEYRRDPDPRFARDLRERLRRQEGRRPLAARGVVRLAALAAGVAVVAALFTIPSVRVSAQSFLELFRVRRFAAVPFSESRFETLRNEVEADIRDGQSPEAAVTSRVRTNVQQLGAPGAPHPPSSPPSVPESTR